MRRPSSAVRSVGGFLGGFLGGLLLVVGCSKPSPDGLPPAAEWQASPTGASSAEAVPVPPPAMVGAMTRANPHAFGGEDSEDPHAGVDMGGAGDPHAGLDLAKNPHAGGGTDVTKMGLAAPDPNRAIDPTRRVTGIISVDDKAKARVKSGTAVFLIVKRAGADGAPSGPPLAVDKLTWQGDSVAFELTDAQAMVAGTELSGDVVGMARYDQDSDALTKEPGDVTGQVRVTIPADHIKLSLDTVLP